MGRRAPLMSFGPDRMMVFVQQPCDRDESQRWTSFPFAAPTFTIPFQPCMFISRALFCGYAHCMRKAPAGLAAPEPAKDDSGHTAPLVPRVPVDRARHRSVAIAASTAFDFQCTEK